MSDHLESCGGAPWDVTNAAKNPRTGPGSPDDERKALLQLVQCFELYPGATGLSHLTALLIRDAAKGRRSP